MCLINKVPAETCSGQNLTWTINFVWLIFFTVCRPNSPSGGINRHRSTQEAGRHRLNISQFISHSVIWDVWLWDDEVEMKEMWLKGKGWVTQRSHREERRNRKSEKKIKSVIHSSYICFIYITYYSEENCSYKKMQSMWVFLEYYKNPSCSFFMHYRISTFLFFKSLKYSHPVVLLFILYCLLICLCLFWESSYSSLSDI